MTNNSDNTDNENPDDFVESDIGAPDEMEQAGESSSALAEAWRTKPLLKVVAILCGVAALGAAAMNIFGPGESKEASSVIRPPSVKEAPGGTLSPYMRQQTEMANEERAKDALAKGESAMPTPVGQTSDTSNFGGLSKKEDPLKELRAETELLKRQVQQQQAQQQIQRPPEQFDNSLAEAMQRQMQHLMTSWVPVGIKSVSILTKDDLEKQRQETAASVGLGKDTTGLKRTTKVIVRAGTVSYAQLLTEANSDVPGPILAQLVSGPLAGARIIGSFQVAYSYDKYLVMTFRLADKDGKSYTINALALDPDTTLGGMATEVDERYFTRVVLPAASAFLSGLGSAISDGGSSITTNGSVSISTQGHKGFRDGLYNGLGEGADKMGQFFEQQANVTKPLVRVAAGTPMGIFFIQPVLDASAEGLTTAQEQQMGQQAAGTAAYAGGQNAAGVDPAAFQNSVPYPNYAGQSNFSTGYGGGYSRSGYGFSGTSSTPYPQQYYGR